MNITVKPDPQGSSQSYGFERVLRIRSIPVCLQPNADSLTWVQQQPMSLYASLPTEYRSLLDSWRSVFLASQFPFILQPLFKAFLLLHYQNNFLIGTYRNKNPESHCLFIKTQETVKIIAKIQSFWQDKDQHIDPVGLSNAVLLTTTLVLQAFGQSCVQHSRCNDPTEPCALPIDTTKPISGLACADVQNPQHHQRMLNWAQDV